MSDIKCSSKNSYKPLVTIITVVYNGENLIEKTILSVMNQTYDNIEYIIIDGGSNDRTLNIMKKYQDGIDYWISERDGGIYDAMNKGVKIATGDFVNFMNAGDIFYSNNVLDTFINKITDKNKVYFGRAKIQHATSSWSYPNEKYNNNNIDLWLKNNLPNHQAMFFPKKFYKNYLYNLEYKIGSDSDYKFQSETECGFVFVDNIICEFEFGGISTELNSFKNTKQILKDSWYISLKHRGVFYALERQIRIIIKYIIRYCLGGNILKKLLSKLRL